MRVYAYNKPQERFALRKAEKIGQSQMFSQYIEEAKKITEASKEENRKEDENDLGIESLSPFADMFLERYFDDIFGKNDIFGGLNLNNNFWALLDKTYFKK